MRCRPAPPPGHPMRLSYGWPGGGAGRCRTGFSGAEPDKEETRMPLIAVLAGDGIGPEVTAEARRVLEALDLGLDFEEGLVGGAGYRGAGHPLPPETLELAQRAD